MFMLATRFVLFFCAALIIGCAPASIPLPSPSCSPGGCFSSELCRLSCPPGCGPHCASAACVNGTCQSIGPCSVCQCTNASQCIHPIVCEDCVLGSGPFCTQSVCINGRCHTIAPCSQKIDNSCEDDGPCFHPDYCEAKCPDGRYPLCAGSKCVKDKCIQIAPCSLYEKKCQ